MKEETGEGGDRMCEQQRRDNFVPPLLEREKGTAN